MLDPQAVLSQGLIMGRLRLVRLPGGTVLLSQPPQRWCGLPSPSIPCGSRLDRRGETGKNLHNKEVPAQQERQG